MCFFIFVFVFCSCGGIQKTQGGLKRILIVVLCWLALSQKDPSRCRLRIETPPDRRKKRQYNKQMLTKPSNTLKNNQTPLNYKRIKQLATQSKKTIAGGGPKSQPRKPQGRLGGPQCDGKAYILNPPPPRRMRSQGSQMAIRG